MPERHETADLVQRFADALNASDLDAVDALLHEDVTFDLPGEGRAFGREAFRRVRMDRARHLDERMSDLAVMVDDHGGRAAVEYTLRGIYRETMAGAPPAENQSYSLSAGMFVEVDDGLITRVTAYHDPVEWRRQVGR